MYFMLDWSNCPEVERVESKVSGAWVFKGTRVPVKALFENLEAGATIYQFLAWFPGVTMDQAVPSSVMPSKASPKFKDSHKNRKEMPRACPVEHHDLRYTPA